MGLKVSLRTGRGQYLVSKCFWEAYVPKNHKKWYPIVTLFTILSDFTTVKWTFWGLISAMLPFATKLRCQSRAQFCWYQQYFFGPLIPELPWKEILAISKNYEQRHLLTV